MEEMVNLFVNNGVAVACLIYFMYYNNTTMKTDGRYQCKLIAYLTSIYWKKGWVSPFFTCKKFHFMVK